MLNVIIYLLFFSDLSIKKGNADDSEIIVRDLNEFFQFKRTDFGLDSKLKFEKGSYLGGGGNVIVWKGSYDGTPVAIKVIYEQKKFEREVAVLVKLEAMTNPNIEIAGIPRVYYCDKMLDSHQGIAMTLFETSLHNVYKDILEKRALLEIDVLQILKQAVRTLEYLNKYDVIHNDIKPDNIFFRGNKIFIADFDLATMNGSRAIGGTSKFASPNFHAKRQCTPMDDVISLIYSLWHVSGIGLGGLNESGQNQNEGEIMEKLSAIEATKRVQTKNSQFKDPHVRDVFTFVCEHEWLAGKSVPNYNLIIKKSTDAIKRLRKWSSFEWTVQSLSNL